MSRFEHAIDVNVPLATAYNQWTQFEEFPHFMEGVKAVSQITDTQLHWVAEIAGRTQEWDAEISEQKPDSRIAWHSTSGSRHDGIVTFHYLSQDTTRVTFQINYEPDGLIENVGVALGVVQRRIIDDLTRFKEFIERRGYETGGWRGEVDRYGSESSFGNRYNETKPEAVPSYAAITPQKAEPAVVFGTANEYLYNMAGSGPGHKTGEVEAGYAEERGERNVLGDDSFTSAENTANVPHRPNNNNNASANWPDVDTSVTHQREYEDLGNSDIAPGDDPAHSFGAVEDEPQNNWGEDDVTLRPDKPFSNPT